MPKKANISSEQLLDVMKMYFPLTESGLLKPRSSSCWLDAASILNISPVSLEATVRQNRHNILNLLRRHYGHQESDCDSIASTDMSSSSSSYSPVVFPSKAFLDFEGELSITWEQWEKIAPIATRYCNKKGSRKYNILKPGWTDFIVEEIWKLFKIPCTYIFKGCKVHEQENSKYYFLIRGMCKECKAVIRGFCFKKPSENDNVVINIKTIDTRNLAHCKKRSLKGTKRLAIRNELLSSKASVWRGEKAHKLMSFGDFEPSFSPDTGMLRKLRQEANTINWILTNRPLI